MKVTTPKYEGLWRCISFPSVCLLFLTGWCVLVRSLRSSTAETTDMNVACSERHVTLCDDIVSRLQLQWLLLTTKSFFCDFAYVMMLVLLAYKSVVAKLMDATAAHRCAIYFYASRVCRNNRSCHLDRCRASYVESVGSCCKFSLWVALPIPTVIRSPNLVMWNLNTKFSRNPLRSFIVWRLKKPTTDTNLYSLI